MNLVFFQPTVNRRLNSGYTLIELMITVVLMGVMVTMVAPLGGIAEDFKLDYLNQRIYSSAVLARSEAIKRTENVSVCRSTAGTACDAGTDWGDGWIIFVNPNKDTVIDAGEEILRVYSQINSPVQIGWDNGQLLTFISRGSSVGQGTFTLCPTSARPLAQRQVNVSGSGLIRKQEGGSCP